MILQSIKMAWEAIISNKLRSFLTMLGIIIGVTALVVLVSLVNGVTGSIVSEVESLGSDMLSISILDDKGAPIRLEDLSSLNAMEEVEQSSPSGSVNGTARYLSNDLAVSVYGVTPAYAAIQRLEIEFGRFLKTADVDNRSYVAVLSHGAAEELFSETEDAVGKRFAIDGRAFVVVGVLKESDSVMVSLLGSGTVYVPFSVESRIAGEPYVTSLAVSASGSVDAAESAVEQWLLKRFQQDDDSYMMINMSSISNALQTVYGMLSVLLGSIAAISLLVGGIGIMNIMLVSVTERTREIGIRKAIGAGHGSIMAQFLIEALMVSLFGCAFGLLLSQVLLMVASALVDSITFTMSLDVVLLAVTFSSAVGLLFGLYPANKAAKKHPIEALRYEG